MAAADLLPAEEVLQVIRLAAANPTRRSAATILRLIHEQAVPRAGSYFFAWMIGGGLLSVGLIGYFAPGPVHSAEGMLVGAALAGIGATTYQVIKTRPLIEVWRVERSQIEVEAIRALISLSITDMRQMGLHRDRLATAKSLLKRGGEDYRRALARILDNADPIEPLVVPSSL